MRMIMTKMQKEIWKNLRTSPAGKTPCPGPADWKGVKAFLGGQGGKKKDSPSLREESGHADPEEKIQEEADPGDGIVLVEEPDLHVKRSPNGQFAGSGVKGRQQYGDNGQKERGKRLKSAVVWSTVLGEPVCRKRTAGRKGGGAQRWKQTGR